MTYDLASVMPQPAKSKRRWGLWAAIAALALIAGAAAYWFLFAGDLTVRGKLVLTGSSEVYAGNTNCRGIKGYDDIRQGAQITVTDATGAVIAIGALGAGEATGKACEFSFTINGVPSGEGFYGIEISHRGVLRYAEGDLDGPLTLSLG